MTGSFGFAVLDVWTETILCAEFQSEQCFFRKSGACNHFEHNSSGSRPRVPWSARFWFVGIQCHWLDFEDPCISRIRLATNNFCFFLETIQSRTTRLSVQKCVSCILSVVSFWVFRTSDHWVNKRGLPQTIGYQRVHQVIWLTASLFIRRQHWIVGYHKFGMSHILWHTSWKTTTD